MNAAEVRAALRSELGADAVAEHEPVVVDGVPVDATVCPADAESLAAALACLGRCEGAAVVRGHGTQLGLGNPPRRADVLLSTDRLVGIATFEPAEGVCRVYAGHATGDLRRHVAAEGWELPLDPPRDESSVGGTLATAAVGPRCLGFGPTRDAVLGLEVALATGERTRCGGRVVKNVSGYDMSKLYTGSFGTLGVITAAWLRLRPEPERRCGLALRAQAGSDRFEAAFVAARCSTARSVALELPAERDAGERVSIELAGDAAAVDGEAAALTDDFGTEETDADAVAAVRARQHGLGGEAGLRFRVAALPTRLREVSLALHAAGASVLCYPGLRLVYAGFALAADAPPEAVRAAFDAVARVTAGEVGSVLCEAAPPNAKSGRDVHGEVAAWLPLFTELKRRFDPGGVLNPGRFAGRL